MPKSGKERRPFALPAVTLMPGRNGMPCDVELTLPCTIDGPAVAERQRQELARYEHEIEQAIQQQIAGSEPAQRAAKLREQLAAAQADIEANEQAMASHLAKAREKLARGEDPSANEREFRECRTQAEVLANRRDVLSALARDAERAAERLRDEAEAAAFETVLHELDAEARRLGEAIGKPVYEHAASYIVASSAAAELRFKLNRIADERERQAAKEELRAMERQHDPSAAAELAAKAQREFSQDELSRRRQKLRLDEPLPEYAHVGEFGSGE